MDIFLTKQEASILGVVEGFDRIIFKGYLTSMFPDGALGRSCPGGACCSRKPGSSSSAKPKRSSNTPRRLPKRRGVPTTFSLSRTRLPAADRRKDGPGHRRAGRNCRRLALQAVALQLVRTYGCGTVPRIVKVLHHRGVPARREPVPGSACRRAPSPRVDSQWSSVSSFLTLQQPVAR